MNGEKGPQTSKDFTVNIFIFSDLSLSLSLFRSLPHKKVCSDSSNSDCRVINGKLIAYFPWTMLPDTIEDESQLLLSTIEYEMDKTDWPGGMQVSYNNGPFPQRQVERSSQNYDADGLSSGAVAGIVIGIILLVGIIAVSAIFYIRNENEQKELFERQSQATKTVPFGSMDQHYASNNHLYHSHGEQYPQGGDDYESDSDSSDSSGSESSEDDDDTSISSFPRSIEGEGKSLVSGDTFPTTAAQAKPQDIEDDGGYASSSGSSNDDEDDDESYSSSESDSEVMMEQQMDHDNNLRKLQQSAASDEHAPIYEDQQGGYNNSYGDINNEGCDAGRDYGQDQGGGECYEEGYGKGSGNYDAQQDESEYDVGQHQQQYHQHEQDNIHHTYPPQKYASNGIESANEDQGDTVSLGSMNSADPPGQSYRDLPQPPQQEDEHWNHPQQTPVHQPHQQPNNDIEYFDETAFQVYENEITGGGLNDSYHSAGSQHYGGGDVDSHSNPGSYHSNQSHSSHHSAFDGGSNRSHHSQGSRQSIRSNSNRSVHSQGSRQSANSNHSSHSQNAVQPQQQHQDQYGQYMDEGDDSFNNNNNHQVNADNVNQNYMEGQHYTNNVNTHNQEYNLPPMPFGDGNEYQQQQQQYNMMNDNMADHHGQFDNNAVGTQYNSSTLPQINTEVYHDQYGRDGTNDGFDEASYHSFNPIGGPSSGHHRPEELDEVSNAGSAYTAKTHQVSNISSSYEHEQGDYSAANSNIPTNQRQGPYGEEEEESITNIFKSLSEIQTRLASKGKEQPLPEGSMPQNDFASRSVNSTTDFEPMDYRSTGSWKEGVVEDGELLLTFFFVVCDTCPSTCSHNMFMLLFFTPQTTFFSIDGWQSS